MQWLASICVKRPVFATVMILTIAVVGIARLQQAQRRSLPQRRLPDRAVMTTLPGRRARADRDRGDGQDRGGGQHHQRHRGAALDLHRGRVAGHRHLQARQGRQRRRPGGARPGSTALPNLPEGTKSPVITKLDPDAAPVLFVAMRSKRPIRDVTEFAEHEVRRGAGERAGRRTGVDPGRAQAPDPGGARPVQTEGGRAERGRRAARHRGPEPDHAGRRGRYRSRAADVPRERARADGAAVGEIIVRAVEGTRSPSPTWARSSTGKRRPRPPPASTASRRW